VHQTMETLPITPDASNDRRTIRDLGPLMLAGIAGAAIVLLLIVTIVPRVQEAVRKARFNSCNGNMKIIGISILNYADYHGHFPPAYTTDAEGNPLHSWRTLILPFMEQQALYDSIDLTKPWDDPVNAAACSTHLRVYQCPDLPNAVTRVGNLTTYLAVVTPESLIRAAPPTPVEAAKAVAETLLIVDAPSNRAVPWMSPHDVDEGLILEFERDSNLQHAVNGMMAGFSSGHVTILTPNLDRAARRALITVSDDDNDAIPAL
jgi:hypothetical protein